MNSYKHDLTSFQLDFDLFLMNFHKCGRREGNDLHWTWGGAHIIVNFRRKLSQKLAKTHWNIGKIEFRGAYRLVWAQIWPLISFGNCWKWMIIIEQKHWYDSLVRSPCCYFRLSTSLAVLAEHGWLNQLGSEQVPYNCGRQTGWAGLAGQSWRANKYSPY